METILNDLFQFDRQLLGSGYDSAMDYINMLIPLKRIKVKSHTQVSNWFIPEEWIIKDGWVKCNGQKILDYKENPLAVTVYSAPVHKKVDLEEFKKHLHTSEEMPKAYSYDFNFYERDWGFSMPKEKVYTESVTTNYDVQETKKEYILPEGEYEVFIDSEFRDGTMQIGVHTIKGKSDREILLFAHLDHPYQANDNLSGVVCLIDLAKQLQNKFDHTIKIVFCPETVGSIAYGELEDISKVDFVIAVDAVGNDNSLLMQKSFDKYSRLNYAMHLASAGQAVDYRKGDFRFVVGSDEYYFNDPKIGIPGIMLSRIPYKEYHSSEDTPEKINYEKIKQVQEVIMKMIDIYEKDFIPVRNFKGPLMRSRYNVQTPHKYLNRELDYLIYDIDGNKYLSEIILPLGMGFEFAYEVLTKLENLDVIGRKQDKRFDSRKKRINKTTK